MLKYFIILLDDTSTSFCHYNNGKSESRLIEIDTLKSGINFAMMENLAIQFVYSNKNLPLEYQSIVNKTNNTSITPQENTLKGDIVVINTWEMNKVQNGVYVLRTNKSQFFERYYEIVKSLNTVNRLNIMFTDLETFTDSDMQKYKMVLCKLKEKIKDCYINGKHPQLNILTDRLSLKEMNNCNAGYESITLAPNGKFYICPAFYYDNNGFDIGDLENGVCIKNPQLYKLKYAPLCKNCDAFQCKRCIYLNWKTTKEVGIPSHEQCVAAHIERNTSQQLLNELRKFGNYLSETVMQDIDYLDPIEIINK